VIDFTTNETVIAAHIHHAPAGVAAPPVIPLNPPVAGSSSGCKQVDQGLLKDIKLPAVQEHGGTQRIRIAISERGESVSRWRCCTKGPDQPPAEGHDPLEISRASRTARKLRHVSNDDGRSIK